MTVLPFTAAESNRAEDALAVVSNQANCSVLRLVIESLDAADEQLISDGHVYHCGPRTPTTMMSSFGLVPYERRRYRRRAAPRLLRRMTGSGS